MYQKEERKFVEVENLNGEIEQAEIIAKVKSQRDNKVYVLLTTDKEINEVVNIAIGYIYEEEDKYNLQLVVDQEELNYVYSLINSSLREG